MSDCDRTLKGIDHIVGKDFADQTHVLLAADPSVVIDGDAAALLASVLQGKKTVVYQRRDLQAIPVKDPENTAFFMAGTDHMTSPSFLRDYCMKEAFFLSMRYTDKK